VRLSGIPNLRIANPLESIPASFLEKEKNQVEPKQAVDQSIDKQSVSEQDFQEQPGAAEQRLFKINLPGSTEMKFKLSFISKVALSSRK